MKDYLFLKEVKSRRIISSKLSPQDITSLLIQQSMWEISLSYFYLSSLIIQSKYPLMR